MQGRPVRTVGGQAIVHDATAGARNEEGGGYQTTLVNFRFMAMPPLGD